MKKIFFLLIAFLLAIIFFLVFFEINQNKNFKIIKINGKEILAEIADTKEKQEKGLSNRIFLSENQGMLFIFNNPDYYYFWMKDTLFPLDFVWIKDKKIIEITKNVKPQDYQPPKTLTSKERVNMVLELNAGIIDKFDLKVGDSVIY